jgi:hypothetical protein
MAAIRGIALLRTPRRKSIPLYNRGLVVELIVDMAAVSPGVQRGLESTDVKLILR